MYKITVYHDNKELFSYESEIIPLPTDVYASIDVPDGNSRTVIHRQLIPNLPNNIIIKVDYTYPELVIQRTKEVPITENY